MFVPVMNVRVMRMTVTQSLMLVRMRVGLR